jgi:hypothetical protein
MRELTPLEYLQVQAKKNKPRRPKPERVVPDGWCDAPAKSKAAFNTEGKAYQALVVAQEIRDIEGAERTETRFYRCLHGRKYGAAETHFHLTGFSFTISDEVPDADQA